MVILNQINVVFLGRAIEPDISYGASYNIRKIGGINGDAIRLSPPVQVSTLEHKKQ
jgi:hypothetical protein